MLTLSLGSGSTAAGFWGDYNCDVPFHTLENLFQYLYTIRDEVMLIVYSIDRVDQQLSCDHEMFIKFLSQQFDFVYLTGDLPAHNVWEITRDEAVSVASYITM